jgi:hypothetical protein
VNWVAVLESRSTPSGAYLSGPEATLLSDYIVNNLKDEKEALYLTGVILRDITPKGMTLEPKDLLRLLSNLDNLTDA